MIKILDVKTETHTAIVHTNFGVLRLRRNSDNKEIKGIFTFKDGNHSIIKSYIEFKEWAETVGQILSLLFFNLRGLPN